MFENVMVALINFAIGLLLAPVLDGIRRKLVARLQNRIGPPILQTLYDIIKLFRKETLIPENSNYLMRLLPPFSFFLSLSILLLIPTVIPEIPIDASIVLLLHLLVLSAFLIALSGSASNNPYGIAGGSREIVLVAIIEPSLVITMIVFSLISRECIVSEIISHYKLNVATIFALIVFILIMIAESGRIPFDIAEAESEVSGGPTIEYSGKLLAFLKYSQLIRSFALFAIFANYIFPVIIEVQGSEIVAYAVFSAFFIVKLIICVIIISLAEALNARFRLFEALKYSVVILILSLIALTLALEPIHFPITF